MPKSAENAHPLRGQATPLAHDIENRLTLHHGFIIASVATANNESIESRTLVSESHPTNGLLGRVSQPK
jgi:hypothetical protein